MSKKPYLFVATVLLLSMTVVYGANPNVSADKVTSIEVQESPELDHLEQELSAGWVWAWSGGKGGWLAWEY